jgi:two-component system, cell cycle sensor histidine kinase and response regulator CckA
MSIRPSWLDDISIEDALERRLAAMIQIFLIGLLVIALTALVIVLSVSEPISRNPWPAFIVLIPVLASGSALVLLRRGHFRRAVMISIAGLLVGLASLLFVRGLHTNAALVLALALPITLAALLIGRRALALTVSLSIAIVVSVAMLQRAGSPLVAVIQPPNYAATVVVFILVVSLLGFFLDSFGTTLREALTAMQARELEVEQSHADLHLRTDELEQEILERKLFGAALRESEERYRLIAENSSDLIGLLDQTGRWVYASPSYYALLGFAPVELIGSATLDYVHPDDRGQLAEQLVRLSEGMVRVSFRMRHADGSWRWLEGVWTAILQGDDRLIVAAGHDITERKSLEAQLLQSQKMEGIGRLAGGVAHDFNNLLTAIIGNAELALDSLPGDHVARADIGEVVRAAGRAVGLTRQLLAFARKQIIEPHVIDLNQLILEMDALLRRLIGEDIELITIPALGLGNIRADPGQIEQVIVNLAVNSRDAMPRGGKLKVETHNALLDQEYTQQHLGVVAGRYVLLVVSDTGVGMDEPTRERIFEPFFTTKQKGQGTGLGLPMCYGIIRQHGGHIWVYSDPGHGSSFKIYLPQIDEPVDAVAQAPDANVSPHGVETILLVEDEAAVRMLAARVLREHGYTVFEASHPDEALTIAGAQPSGSIQLLLTDVVMPRMSGRALAEELLKLRPDIKTMFISGYTDNAIVHHGRLDPGVAFLPKPFSPATLVRKVREILDAAEGE